MILVVWYFLLFIKSMNSLSFPESSVTCPEFFSLYGMFFQKKDKLFLRLLKKYSYFFIFDSSSLSQIGHSAAITGLSYVNNSAYYISADSSNLILLSDIRSGEKLNSITYATDSNGVVNLNVLSSGLALIITKIEIILINLFTLSELLYSTITTDAG